jgi:hypothetical protein
MVRKDGFMRVAQDFRQAGFLAFPEGYLDTPDGASDYSDYVTTETKDWYDANYTYTGGANLGLNNGNLQDRINAPTAGEFPGDSDVNATTLPFLGLNSQQMRSRGIYIDHLTQPALEMLDCVNAALLGDGDTADCGAPGVTNLLQIMPFYELQTTWLSFWDTDPPGDPVSVTNEAVADDNNHSRGYAVLENELAASSTPHVISDMYRGNIGLSVTDPITEYEHLETNFSNSKGSDMVYVAVNGGGVAPEPTGYIWEADFGSAVNRVEAADTIVTPQGNEYCTRTSTMLRCMTPNDSAGSIVLTGYTKLNGQTFVPLYICATEPDGQDLFTISNSAGGAVNTATLSWPALNGYGEVGLVLSIEDQDCGT